MKKKTNLVYGWGVNDVEYPVCKTETVGGKSKLLWICPYYEDWRAVVRRCHSEIFKEKHSTYSDCTVCEEWKYLSNFIKWVDSQPNKNWENCCLDKDILFVNNKHYSPETCVYISVKVNTFALTCSNTRGAMLLGVGKTAYNVKDKKYLSRCSNPFSSRDCYVGTFITELEAHKAWQAKKHEYACRLADLQEDPRVADALRQRYAPDKDWTKA